MTWKPSIDDMRARLEGKRAYLRGPVSDVTRERYEREIGDLERQIQEAERDWELTQDLKTLPF